MEEAEKELNETERNNATGNSAPQADFLEGWLMKCTRGPMTSPQE